MTNCGLLFHGDRRICIDQSMGVANTEIDPPTPLSRGAPKLLMRNMH
jgi:hypothetical protein